MYEIGWDERIANAKHTTEYEALNEIIQKGID
jgi:hypothetical protein